MADKKSGTKATDVATDLPVPPEGKQYVILADQEGQEILLLLDEDVDVDSLNWEDPELLSSIQQQTAAVGDSTTTSSEEPSQDDSQSCDLANTETEPTTTEAGDQLSAVLDSVPSYTASPSSSKTAVKTSNKPRILKRDKEIQDDALKKSSMTAENDDNYALVSVDEGRFDLIKVGGDGINAGVRFPVAARPKQRSPSKETRKSILLDRGFEGTKYRVPGSISCQECGATFVNNARLDRHLAVHQVFGSYLCPLCGKTYKYEYNLFHHWRNTCVDVGDYDPDIDRTALNITDLRALVEKIENRKSEIGAEQFHRELKSRNGGVDMEPEVKPLPELPLARCGQQCRICKVTIMSAHLQQHMSVHLGQIPPDRKSVNGVFFCDFCGLMFRSHKNLVRHWRSQCPELPNRLDLTATDVNMTDADLIRICTELLRDSSLKSNVDGGLITSSWSVVTASAATGPDGQKKLGAGSKSKDTDNDDSRPLTPDIERPVSVQRTPIDDTSPRYKWSLTGGPVKCPECHRTFANEGRLERHLLGFHTQNMRHRCVLCGNRFKYDYNLIYHYRHSCPYTKSYIPEDIRLTTSADKYREIVRCLAQKDEIERDALASSQSQPQSSPGPSYATPSIVYQCPLCAANLQSEELVHRHIAIVHADEIEDHGVEDVKEREGGNNDASGAGRQTLKDAELESIEQAVDLQMAEDEMQPGTSGTTDTQKDKQFTTLKPLKRSTGCVTPIDTFNEYGIIRKRSRKSNHGVKKPETATPNHPTCRLCRAEYSKHSEVVTHWRSGTCEPLMAVCETEYVKASLSDIRNMDEHHLTEWINSFEIVETTPVSEEPESSSQTNAKSTNADDAASDAHPQRRSQRGRKIKEINDV